MGDRRVVSSAFGVLVACLSAIALAVPAVAMAAKPPATKQIVYRTSQVGDKETTVYNRGGLKLRVGCDTSASLSFSHSRQTGRFIYTGLYSNDDVDASPSNSQLDWTDGLGSTYFASNSEQIFETMIKTDGSIYSVDGVLASPGFGRRCSFAGLVTQVPEARQVDVIASEDGFVPFTPAGLTAYELRCDTGVSLAAQTGSTPNVYGSDFFDPGGWSGRVAQLATKTLVASNSQGGTIFNGMTTPASGRLSLLRLALTDDDAAGCQGFGFAQNASKGASRVFYAANSTKPRKRILNLGGLQLFARCDPGRERIYAATTKPNAMLALSIFGDGEPVDFYDQDFDDKPGKPQFLIDLGSLERTGQLIYAQPSGRVVSLRYTGWAGTSEFGECGFSGIARTGG